MATAEARGVRAAPPSLALFLAEGQRAVLESLALRPSAALLRSAPLPQEDGVRATPLGPRGDLPSRLAGRVDALHRRYRRPVSIVGWSLGGIYAREIAKRMPERVRPPPPSTPEPTAWCTGAAVSSRRPSRHRPQLGV